VQVELRFPIWGELHGAAFTDRGGVWLDPDDADIDDTRWSVGTGLRYYTPAGALSADLAWNVDNEEDEEDLVFHFSIGFPF
jgi:outer membrane translocation and assembly module TamA